MAPSDRPPPDRRLRGLPGPELTICALPGLHEEDDTPQHFLLRCPSLSGIRLHTFGCIYSRSPDLLNDDAVAALDAGYRRLQSLLASNCEPMSRGRWPHSNNNAHPPSPPPWYFTSLRPQPTIAPDITIAPANSTSNS